MQKPRHTVGLSTPMPSSAPPVEFQIWPFGEIETTKGTFLFDRAAARSVLGAWRMYGNRLTIDYEHKAVDPDRRAGDGKSAGSFLLEVRSDGLYAVDVRWTPPAFAALSNKEWLYFSPYFSAEQDSGRILELINLALTNIPATRNMTPLVAASRSYLAMEDDKDKEQAAALAEGDTPPPSDDDKKTAAKKAAKQRMAKLRAALADAEEEYASLAEGDDDSAAPSSEEDETLADGEDDEDKPAAASAVPAAKPTTAAASRIVAAASAATGKSDPAEIVGALTALSKTQRVNVSLSKRVAELERKLLRGDVVAMVNAAVRSGKLTPAEREWALSYGMESPGKLRGYLDVTPQRAVVAGGETREPRASNTGAGTVALSDVERRICENAGIDPVKFAEAKNRPIRFSEG